MTSDLLTFVTCKCCGVERKSTAFHRTAKGKVSGVCSTCSYKQSIINHLKDKPNLTTQQEERLNDAIAWFKACKETTGYEMRKYSRVDFSDPEALEKIKQAAEAHKLATTKEVL